MTIRFLILLAGMMIQGFIVMGQSNSLPGVIPSVFYRGRITNRFDYNFFASTTFIPVSSTIEGHHYSRRNSEIYLQPSLIYKYSGEVNFAAGYTYIKGNSFKSAYETEQQVWQQIILEHKAFRGLMLHRFRLVENLKKNISPLLNYQIAFEMPLQGRVIDPGEFYFTCFNESFLNLSYTANFYPANWAFAGIGFKTLKAGRFEIGPMVQTTFNTERNNETLYLLQILWIGDIKLFSRN